MQITNERIHWLQELDIGNSVAESDDHLVDYFYETSIFQRFVKGKIDIIAGDKGSGKTAICQYVISKANELEQLRDVVIIQGFNPKGRTVFQRLCESQPMAEKRYITVWKTYILSLAGNWAIQFFEEDKKKDRAVTELDDLLRRLGLRAVGEGPNKIFSKVTSWFKKYINPKEGGVKTIFSDDGDITVATYAAYDNTEPEAGEELFLASPELSVEHEEALGLLDGIIGDLGVSVWVMLDRLDEAFAGHRDVETPALQALLRTYLDLLAFKHIKIKLFLRKDLFLRVVEGGFVNLTHVNTNKTEIIWNEDDLQGLLLYRIKSNKSFADMIAESNGTKDDVSGVRAGKLKAKFLSSILPSHIDTAKRQTAWQWIVTKTRDGNRSIQPRNLIDLMLLAQEEQLKKERLNPYHKRFPLFTREAIINAFDRLSVMRVEDTILAEMFEVAAFIRGLRDGKAEHNDQSLAKAFGVDVDNVKIIVDVLVDVGFLEARNGFYRVPILYRKGLNIKQGKAYRTAKKVST